MGNCLGIFRRKKLNRHIVLIMIGLDNAGKTKTVNNLIGDTDEKVIPTVGFKAVNLIHKDVPVTIYDLGGGPNFRQIWPQYYSEVHGVIFVIDSSDYSRLDECHAVLEEVLSHDKISGKPVLVLANKQDKHGALDDIDVVEKLHIEPLVNKYRCPTLVESYSANVTFHSKKPELDPGLKKGYQWLLNYIIRRYGDMNLRVQTDIHAELERRRAMMNKPNTRASLTFTAVSDEIATQTGFSNPNYETLTRVSSAKPTDNSEQGIICVQPHPANNTSLESTITIESMEDSEITSGAKPKSSYGQPSDSSTMEALVEDSSSVSRPVTGRMATDRGDEKPVDFADRPQSSPSIKKKRAPSPPSPPRVNEVRDVWLESGSPLVSKLDAIPLNTRADVSSKCPSDVSMLRSGECGGGLGGMGGLGGAGGMGAGGAVRPVSASAALRRQLEVHSHSRRRLSLRYMQRNRLMPERVGGGSKGDLKRNYLSRGDVTI